MTSDLDIKAAVRRRDSYRCRDCGITQEEYAARCKKPLSLDVHRLSPDAQYSVDGTVALCKRCHRRRHGRGHIKPVRINSELVRDARIIAATLGKSLPEYVAAVLTEAVARDMPKAAKAVSKRADRKQQPELDG